MSDKPTPQDGHTRSWYTVTVDADSSVALMRLIKAPFENVVFKYNRVDIGPRNPDGSAPCKFDYDIVEWPEGFDTDAFNGQEFLTLISDVLLGLIEGNMLKEYNAAPQPPPPTIEMEGQKQMGGRAMASAIPTVIRGAGQTRAVGEEFNTIPEDLI